MVLERELDAIMLMVLCADFKFSLDGESIHGISGVRLFLIEFTSSENHKWLERRLESRPITYMVGRASA